MNPFFPHIERDSQKIVERTVLPVNFGRRQAETDRIDRVEHRPGG